MRHSVVPGHARRLLDQRLEPARSFRVHGFRPDTDPVFPSLAGVRSVRSAMRTFVTWGNPDDQNFAAIQSLRGEDRGVAGLQCLATPAYPSLGGFDLRTAQADRRPLDTAFRFGDSDNHVTAVEILMVVGKRADRLQYLEAGGIGTPDRLELHTHGLDRSAAEKIVNADGQDGAHSEIVVTARQSINESSA